MKLPIRLGQRVAFASIAVSLAMCSSLDTISISETSQSTIPQGSVLEQFVGDLGFGEFFEMDLSQNQELRNQGVEKHQIDSVYLTSLELTITTPQDADFTFIDTLEFYVESEGLPRQRIAYGGPFDVGVNTVSLSLDDVDLANYVAAATMQVTTEAEGRRPAEDTTISAALGFAVDVNVGGAICGD